MQYAANTTCRVPGECVADCVHIDTWGRLDRRNRLRALSAHKCSRPQAQTNLLQARNVAFACTQLHLQLLIESRQRGHLQPCVHVARRNCRAQASAPVPARTPATRTRPVLAVLDAILRRPRPPGGRTSRELRRRGPPAAARTITAQQQQCAHTCELARGSPAMRGAAQLTESGATSSAMPLTLPCSCATMVTSVCLLPPGETADVMPAAAIADGNRNTHSPIISVLSVRADDCSCRASWRCRARCSAGRGTVATGIMHDTVGGP